MMFAKEAEALAYAEPLVPKRYHTWLRVLTQWKNDKERNGESDRWVKYFCPYFTTEGLLRQAWDDARRVGGADCRKLVRIVTAWHGELGTGGQGLGGHRLGNRENEKAVASDK